MIMADPANSAAAVFHCIFLGLDGWNGEVMKIEILCHWIQANSVMKEIEFTR